MGLRQLLQCIIKNIPLIIRGTSEQNRVMGAYYDK